MNQELLNRIMGCSTLPTLPAAAVRVLELTSNPNVAIDELTRVIQNDQALSVKVLRTVNSTFYSLRRPCASINQAMVLLGLSSVKSLVLSFSLVSTVASGNGEGFDYLPYWRRGLYTAVAAKTTARAAGVVQEDEVFLGGLLQDVGMVAMHRALGAEYAAIAKGDHRRLASDELQTFDVQHPEVGAMLAERWRLPIELIVPIRFHEQPTAAPAQYANLIRCVGLGNLAHDVLTDRDPGAALAKFHTRAAEWFEIDAPLADDLIHRIAEGARQLSPLFQVNTGPYPDAEAVMARAREQIASLAVSQTHPNHDPLRTLVADSEQHDALTGLLDPRALQFKSEAAFTQSMRDRSPISVLSIGIDSFDRLTATGGDDAGDAALVELAALIESHVTRRGALVGRDGRCTFCVVLPGMARPDAARAAAAFRTSLQTVSPGWALPGLEPRPLAVSIGIAAAEAGSPFASAGALIESACRAREAASAAGGDGVRTFLPRIAA